MTYVLNVKLGGAEFHGEGDKEEVRADYQLWLEALRASGGRGASVNDSIGSATQGGASASNGESGPRSADDDLLARVFHRDREGIVSMLVKPKDVPDQILLMIYGHLRLTSEPFVFAVTLARSLRKSGCPLDRMDRVLGTHEGTLITKAGAKRGTKYSLTNPGKKRAEELMAQLLE
ncbi:MAG TPA: hypothetical protein VFY71_09680 [Planctomycetota bacterium]|nr:hypothetical protein [Planctomycetota bacterium]